MYAIYVCCIRFFPFSLAVLSFFLYFLQEQPIQRPSLPTPTNAGFLFNQDQDQDQGSSVGFTGKVLRAVLGIFFVLFLDIACTGESKDGKKEGMQGV